MHFILGTQCSSDMVNSCHSGNFLYSLQSWSSFPKFQVQVISFLFYPFFGRAYLQIVS